MAAMHPDTYVRLPRTGLNTSRSVLPAARWFRAGRGRGGNVWENDGEKREVWLNERIWMRKKGRCMVVFSICVPLLPPSHVFILCLITAAFSKKKPLPSSHLISSSSSYLSSPPSFPSSSMLPSSPPGFPTLPFPSSSSPSVQIICALCPSLAVIAVVVFDSTSNRS